MELIDSHCHFDLPAFDVDRAEVLARCRGNGISKLIIPAIEAKTWQSLLSLCQQNDGLYAALGLHPMFLANHNEFDLLQLETLIKENHQGVIAVGEIGLDYFLPELDKDRQQALFEAQLALAQSSDLPVILHVRKAHDQVLSTLRRMPVCGGIVHAFSGSLQQANQYINLGFKLGFGGTLTYERANKIRRLASELPLTSLVLETDAPDMPLAAYTGERNSPEYIAEILSELATIRGQAPALIAKQTTENVKQVFRI